MNPLILDNTKRSIFRQCKRKYLYQVIHGLQSNIGSTALRYGVVWHGIQEGYHTYVKENGWPETEEQTIEAMSIGLALGQKKWISETEGKTYNDDYKNFNTAAEAFGEYLTFFKDDPKYLTILATERKFECPILPESKKEEELLKDLPDIFFTGRIDLCVEMDGLNWLFDFKSTGWRLDEVISKANRSPQLIGYSYAGKTCMDFEPDGCLLSFAQLSSTKSKKTETWGTVRHTFRRVPQIFTPADIASWKSSFIDTVRDILRAAEENAWTESFDNCFQYGACPYLRLCRQNCDVDELNLEGFHVAYWDVLDD